MSSYSKSITVFVSGRCNLSCVYCYSAMKKLECDIDLDFVRRGITDFYKKHQCPYLRLFGTGEPTINLALMDDIVHIARDVMGSSVHIELQSNGFFTDSVGDWVEDNVNILWLSCDGPPDIHDRYRPTKEGKPSSDIVLHNIQRFASSGKCSFGVRATITQETSHHQSELVAFFHGIGIRHICADPVFKPVSYGTSDGNFPHHLLITDPVSYSRDFLLGRERAYELGTTYDSIITVNFTEGMSYGCRGCYTSPHLTPDGAVTCCDMAFSSDTPLKEMVWGVYNPRTGIIEYDQEKINIALNRRSENLPICRNCEFKNKCAGGCFGEALNEGKSITAIKSFNCRAAMRILPELEKWPMKSPIAHP